MIDCLSTATIVIRQFIRWNKPVGLDSETKTIIYHLRWRFDQAPHAQFSSLWSYDFLDSNPLSYVTPVTWLSLVCHDFSVTARAALAVVILTSKAMMILMAMIHGPWPIIHIQWTLTFGGQGYFGETFSGQTVCADILQMNDLIRWRTFCSRIKLVSSFYRKLSNNCTKWFSILKWPSVN